MKEQTRSEPCPHPQCDGGWLKSEDEAEIGQPCPVCSEQPTATDDNLSGAEVSGNAPTPSKGAFTSPVQTVPFRQVVAQEPHHNERQLLNELMHKKPLTPVAQPQRSEPCPECDEVGLHLPDCTQPLLNLDQPPAAQPQCDATEFQDAAYYLVGAREGEQPPATDDSCVPNISVTGNIPDGVIRPRHKLTDLVQRFANALLEKLEAAEVKYGYTDGWMNPDWEDECQRKLSEHIKKGDPRDVAAFCAFMWHHGWRTISDLQATDDKQWRVEKSNDHEIGAWIVDSIGNKIAYSQFTESINGICDAHNSALVKSHQDGWYEGRNYEIKLRSPTDYKQWTVERLRNYFKARVWGNTKSEVWVKLADDINAAVAAEREKREKENTNWREAVGNLATLCREKTEQLLQAQAAIAEANKQITVVCCLSGDVAHQCDFHAIDASKWWKAVLKLQKMIVVDLSALDKHDAEVRSKALNDGYAACAADTKGKERFLREDEIAEARKPLVDALKKSHQILGALVRALDAGALSMNPSTLLTDIRVAFKKCDAAIADAKTDRASVEKDLGLQEAK
jgi:hypothetical protein